MFVEGLVEEHNLARDFGRAQRLQFIEIVDRDDLGGEAVRGSGSASAQGRQHDLLGGSGNHLGVFDQFRGLCSANPVGNGDRLETDFQAQLAKFAGDVLRGGGGLGRTGSAGSDICREVRQFTVGVVVVERSGFDGGELL